MIKSKTKFSLVLIIVAIIILIVMGVAFNYERNCPKQYLYLFKFYSKEYEVSLELILAVAKTESGFEQELTSNKGAVGIMQIMPKTAEFVKEKYSIEGEISNSQVNIEVGVAYLSYLKDKYQNLADIICSYNAGEGRVNKWKSSGLNLNNANEIPFKETANYYKKVRRRIKLYKFLY